MKEHALDFVTRFVLSATLGSAAIIAVAPFVRPDVLPAWLAEPSTALRRASPTLAHAADTLTHTFYWSPSKHPRPAARSSSLSPSSSTQTADSTPRWAVIHAPNAAAYSASGKFLRRYPAGTALTIVGAKDSTAGKVIECKLQSGETFLLRDSDLNIHAGALASLDPGTLAQHEKLARLQAELQQLKEAGRNQDRTDNPYYPPFTAARETYQAYWKQVRDLQKRQESSTGDERMKASDELRRLKGEDIRIGKEYESARNQYNAWNTAHPKPASTTNPRATALESQIATLSQQLSPPSPF